MTFFDLMDELKKNPSLKITRELWDTPHYYIYWNTQQNAFYEHFSNIDREWASESQTFFEDVSAKDWVKIA